MTLFVLEIYFYHLKVHSNATCFHVSVVCFRTVPAIMRISPLNIENSLTSPAVIETRLSCRVFANTKRCLWHFGCYWLLPKVSLKPFSMLYSSMKLLLLCRQEMRKQADVMNLELLSFLQYNMPFD